MLFINGTLRHPLLHQLLLGRREFLVGLHRRHQLVLVGGEDAVHQLTLTGFSRHDRPRARLSRSQCLLPQIQPQLTFPGAGIRPVAGKTVVREDRSDVTIVTQNRRGCCLHRRGAEQGHRGDQRGGTEGKAQFDVHEMRGTTYDGRAPFLAAHRTEIPPLSPGMTKPGSPSARRCYRRGAHPRRRRRAAWPARHCRAGCPWVPRCFVPV